MSTPQPERPLLKGNAFQAGSEHVSNVYTIARKPVPITSGKIAPNARNIKNEQGGSTDNFDESSDSFLPPESVQRLRSKSLSIFARQQNPAVGRLQHIIIVCSFLILPLYGVTTALLVVVYNNRLPHSPLSTSEPCTGLVVGYGASQLTSLSTWISTVATVLAPAFMALLSYPVAKSMTQRIKNGQHNNDLPSPYQTGLLIELLGGSITALWGSLSYMLSRKRSKVPPVLHLSFLGLLCGVLFGVLAQLADFWLHRATHSIIYTVAKPADAAPYGRELSNFCRNYYAMNGASQASCTGIRINGTELNIPCSAICGEYNFYPTRFDQGFLLANSLPTNSSLTVTNVSGHLEESGATTIVALLPADVDSDVTWTAKTVAVGTRCEYIFDKCYTQVDAVGSFFSCASLPVGYNSTGPLAFNNSDVGSDFGYILRRLFSGRLEADSPYNLTNPWTFGLSLRMDAVVRGYTVPDNLPYGDNTVFTIVRCNATTYDVEYSVGTDGRKTNSSISSMPVDINKLERSNEHVHNTVQGQILHSTTNTADYLQKAMLAALFSEKSGEVLSRFEQEYGKVALSFASPSFEASPTIKRSIIEQHFVSCVQMAPLWSLVGLVGAYIVLAIVFATVAVVSSSNNRVRSAQRQLSVLGLAAKAFKESGPEDRGRSVKSLEDLFEEKRFSDNSKEEEARFKRHSDISRVGFTANEAGRWEYDVRPGTQNLRH